MRSPAQRRSNGVVSHRPQQRMAEFHPVAGETDQPGRLCLAEGVSLLPPPSRAAAVVTSMAGHRPAAAATRSVTLAAELTAIQAGGEPLPDRRARLQRPPGYVRAVELFRRQNRCQLHQCERIAAGLGVMLDQQHLRRPMADATARPAAAPGRRTRRHPAAGRSVPACPCAASLRTRPGCGPGGGPRTAAPHGSPDPARARIIDQDQQRTVFCGHGLAARGTRRHY